jgi:protein-arginine kinase activator protein McsA
MDTSIGLFDDHETRYNPSGIINPRRRINLGATKVDRIERVCPNCKNVFYVREKEARIYCSMQCYQKSRYSVKSKLTQWLFGNLDGCLIESGSMKGELRPRLKEIIKSYILDKQDHKCIICGCSDIWHGKNLIFILDHIDGDWSNNKPDNFRLVCPNCNSQLDTTKRNRGHGRFSSKYYLRKQREKLKEIE